MVELHLLNYISNYTPVGHYFLQGQHVLICCYFILAQKVSILIVLVHSHRKRVPLKDVLFGLRGIGGVDNCTKGIYFDIHICEGVHAGTAAVE